MPLTPEEYSLRLACLDERKEALDKDYKNLQSPLDRDIHYPVGSKVLYLGKPYFITEVKAPMGKGLDTT